MAAKQTSVAEPSVVRDSWLSKKERTVAQVGTTSGLPGATGGSDNASEETVSLALLGKGWTPQEKSWVSLIAGKSRRNRMVKPSVRAPTIVAREHKRSETRRSPQRSRR